MRGFLLDTNVLLWAIQDGTKLGPEARRLVDAGQDLFVSAASVWEIAIKRSIGKLKLANDEDPIATMQATGTQELAITWEHAEAVARLPPLHRDPFDRLLVAQALIEDLILVTSDATLRRYPVRTIF